MFTGIIEEMGIVESVSPSESGFRLKVTIRKCGRGLRLGDSLAVNGCCLTVVKIGIDGRKKHVCFDLLQETWIRTNLQFLRAGSLVNLERALAAGGRLSGHFVTGHVDALAKITRWEKVGNDHQLRIVPPLELMRYMIHKGSIAEDGIILTVAEVTATDFMMWIIPHTLESTALKERSVGGFVNIEADILGKYVERLSRQSVL